MVRTSKIQITNEEYVFTEEDMKFTLINEELISNLFAENGSANEFLAKCRLIRNSNWCEFCEGSPRLSYVKDISALDGYRWRCKRPCTFTKTIRSRSLFESSKHNFKDIFRILCEYMNSETFTDIAFEINRDVDHVSKITDLAREVICHFVENNTERIGGRNIDNSRKIVEIDENLFSKENIIEEDL
jgi:hypothetical protein